MSLQRRSKWMQQKRAICHKFEDAVERTREQTAQYWNELALPKIKATQRKPKPPKPKGSHKTVKAILMNKSYRQAEERDYKLCVVCNSEARSHHHIIKQSTRYRPEYLQRMENIVCICAECHDDIHRPRGGKHTIQEYLEQWQQRYYPEYSAMMKELAKVTGCRDEWLIQRWLTQQYNNNTAIGG